jgi:hypothetical protein
VRCMLSSCRSGEDNCREAGVKRMANECDLENLLCVRPLTNALARTHGDN